MENGKKFPRLRSKILQEDFLENSRGHTKKEEQGKGGEKLTKKCYGKGENNSSFQELKRRSTKEIPLNEK